MRRLLTIPALLALGACGFSPLYATNDEGIRGEMRMVAVGEITGPADAAYYTQGALADVLPGGASDPRYSLSVRLRDQRRAIAVTRSATTTRYDYVLLAGYTLNDTQTGETRTNSVQTTVSYGVVDSQYASLVGREDAVRRASLDLARRIETDVALYLKGRAPDTAPVPVPPVIDEDGDGELRDFEGDELGVPGPGAKPAIDEGDDS